MSTPFITTDLSDYPPGSTSIITAGGFTAGSAIRIQVQHVTDAGADGQWGTLDDLLGDNSGSGHLPWYVVDGGVGDLDGLLNGAITTHWYVDPDDSGGARFLLSGIGVAAGSDGVLGTADDTPTGELATNTFTDNVSATIDQWSNGPAPDVDGTGSDNEEWQNGNLGASQAHYAEGESIPYRAILDDLIPGTEYSYTIQWDTVDTGAYAIDYLTGYNFTFEGTKHPLEPDPVPAFGITDLSSAAISTVAIPGDPQLLTGFNSGTTTGLGSGQPSGAQVFTLFGAVSNLSTSGYTYETNSGGVLNKASITVTFTYTGGAADSADSVVLTWGGHIASGFAWNPADDPAGVQSASDISGSPYHMRQLDLLEGGVLVNIGNVDRSTSAAVVANPDFAITKVVADILNPDNSDGGAGVDQAGDKIVYTITMDNTGDENLTGVTVVDAVEGGTAISATYVSGDDGDNVLETNEIWTYSATYVVTQDDIDTDGLFGNGVGGIQNTATGDTDQIGPKTASAEVPPATIIQSPALNIVKTATPGQVADVAGELITYTLTVDNTGNQTLTNIVVTDANANPGSILYVSGDTNNDNKLGVAETWVYSAAHTVTQAEIDSNGGGDGDLDNTAFADSTETAPDSDDEAVPVLYNPSLNITKAASVPGGTANVAGELISYVITVQNTGNTTLTGLSVTDPYANAAPVRGADVVGDGDALFEVGETWGFSAQHTVTQAEIDSNGDGDGLLENTATADSNETGPDTASASVPVAPLPSLNITKAASVPGGTADAAGEMISYVITVANTGNTTLTGVTVTDPYANAAPVRGADVVGDGDALLEVGEIWGYTAQHTVTQAEIDSNGGGNGQLENIATADSTETGPDTADASVPVDQNPSLNINKDASVPGGTADMAGELISYTITVANTGNVTLTGVTVTDPYADAVPGVVRNVLDVIGDEDNLLEVGEVWGYTAQHTVTQAELDSNGGGNGVLENTATADSAQTDPDTDDANVPLTVSGALNITKAATVPGGTADAAGDVISYTITVANTGNITLTGVTVTDPYADAVPGVVRNLVDVIGDEDNLLEVGEVWGYTAQHTVTQAEIDSNGGGNGLLENIATADSAQTGPDTDDADVPVARTPSLSITKSATVAGGTADAAGEVISYVITLANTGNTTLTAVTVTDPYADAVPGVVRNLVDVVGDEDNLLEVGEIWGYTAQHTVTQAEIDSNGGGNGKLENTATADSAETGPDTDDADVPVARNPNLNIVKNASVAGGTADVAGEIINYTITVTNTGNTTLTGVTVSDPYADAVPGVARNALDVIGDEDNLLEVGEVWGYTAQHTVTQAEIDSNGGGNGLLENTATADSAETGPDTDNADVPVATSALLNITKEASVAGGTADVAGELISYVITVANMGNTTLTGVTVTDPYADAVPGVVRNALDVIGDEDNLLEIGEIWGYTAQHTVTQAEIDSFGGGNGLLENTATADSVESPPDSDNADVPVARTPSLNITKAASVPGGTANAAGELISYVITVQNTGNTTLTGLSVTDPYANAAPVRGADVVGDGDALFEVGETWGFSAQHTVTQAEIDSNGGGDGLLENTATADSNETGPDTASASVPVAPFPSLNITKAASVPGGTADVAGELISYVITVQNTGNTTLTGVTVSDPFANAAPVRGADVLGDGDAQLEVGETWGYTAQHTVTQAEIDSFGGGNGLLENIATADSVESPPDTDDADVPVARTPSLNITKAASIPGGTADVAGELISYVITVANTGNTTLTGVTVTDAYADAVPGVVRNAVDVMGDEDNLLEVGEIWGYTAQHTVTQAELDSFGGGDGRLDNTATADSVETGPDTASASVPVEVDGPGVRTPGFWKNWTEIWDANGGNDGKFSGKDHFPLRDILLFQAGLPGAPYPNGGNVNDPATAANEQTDASATSGKGILIGDWNQNGQTDAGESTLYWSLTEAYRALDASQSETKQDARLILARDMVSTWLNFMAGNPVGSVNPADGVNSPKEHLIEAIQWMQLLTPDENGDRIGDGYIKVMGSAVNSPAVPSSSSAWNNDVTSQLQIPLIYRSNTGVPLPVEAGSQTHNALDEYNNFGTIGGYVWAQDGDAP